MKHNNTINNNKTLDYSAKTVPELKAIAKKMGLSGYSKAKKEHIIQLITETKERLAKAKTQALENAKEEAKFALGADYANAVLFYKDMRSVKYMGVDDYASAVNLWRMMSLLSSGQVMGYSIDNVAEYFSRTFTAPFSVEVVDTTLMTPEQKVEYVRSYLDVFEKNTTTSTHTKGTYSIVKMKLAHVKYDKQDKLVFNSAEALDLTADIIPANKNAMRIVKTAEDGLYRVIKTRKDDDYYEATYKACVEKGMTEEQAIYEAMGLPMVSIDLNIDSFNSTELASMSKEQRKKAIEKAQKKKEKLLKEGFTDEATGYHYLFLKLTPSEARKGCATFIKANSWSEIYQLWYEFTGLGSYEAFKDAFGTDKGVVFSKLLTRIASRGSNSFSSMKLYDEEHRKMVKNTRVLFVPEYEFSMTRIQKEAKNTENGTVLELNKQGIAKLKPGDGQALFSNRYCAMNAGGMRMITANEEQTYLAIWEKCGCDIAEAEQNPTFRRLESKIPAVWQIRGGVENMQSLKGTGVKCFFEHIKVELTAELANDLNKLNGTAFKEGDTLCLGDYDVICPESVAKFMYKGEATSKEFNLEICNYLKRKGEWVCLNPQFIASLDSSNPNVLNPIVRFWGDQIYEAFDDIAKMQKLMNIVSYSNSKDELAFDDIMDDDNEDIQSADLSTILIANRKLASDPKVREMIQDKIEKFVKEMRVGRVRVPGMYTYMVQDPRAMLNAYFGLELSCLESGEFYFNNKTCKAGFFRSPLIAPFEAQKVQLVANELYWAYKDVALFNAYDGAWDLMGGADYDGDTCAVVPADDANGFGKLVVESIRDKEIPVYAEARSAQKAIWNELQNENLIEYLCTVARDNTGVFTNYATRLLDISNHFAGIKHFAKHNKCQFVEFISPEAFGERNAKYGKYGMNFQCSVNKDTKTFLVRGIVPCEWDDEQRKHVFLQNDSGAVVGTYTLDELDALSKDFLKLVEVLRVFIGEEIDGAKTGYHPVVPAEYQCKMNPHWFMTRQCFLNRVDRVYKKDKNGDPTDKIMDEPTQYNVAGMLDTIDMPKYKQYNVFYSFSMMGRIHDLTWQIMHEKIMPRFKQGTDKMSLLKGLMSDAEHSALNLMVQDDEGNNMSLIKLIAKRKQAYNQNMHSLQSVQMDEDDSKTTIANLKYREAKALAKIASDYNIPMEAMACGAYLATYDKNGQQNKGLSYAWILWPELISVFSRDNESFELFKLPDTAKQARVANGVLYVDDKKYMPVKAKDGEILIQYFGGTKAFGLLHKDNGVSVTAAPVRVSAGAMYDIGVYGFGYANREAKSVTDWESIVKNVCKHKFYILPDKDGALCTAYIDTNGVQHNLAQVMLKDQSTSNVDLELCGKLVTCEVPDSPLHYKKTDRTISNIRVRVIG